MRSPQAQKRAFAGDGPLPGLAGGVSDGWRGVRARGSQGDDKAKKAFEKIKTSSGGGPLPMPAFQG